MNANVKFETTKEKEFTNGRAKQHKFVVSAC